MFQVAPSNPLGTSTSCDWTKAQTAHTTMNVATGDGALRSVDGSVDPLVWASWLTAQGSESLGDL